MTTTKEQVLEMIAAGQITPAQGDELLQAMTRPRQPMWRWLTKPFEAMGTPAALAVGAVTAAAQLVVARSGVRFPGTVDVKWAPHAVSWERAATDQAIAWLGSALIFWLVAYAVKRQGRLIDFIGALGVSRVPLLAVALITVAASSKFAAVMEQPEDPAVLAGIIAPTLATIVLLIWSITVLVTGFRAASGLRGAKGTLAFIGTLLGAEIVTNTVSFLITRSQS